MAGGLPPVILRGTVLGYSAKGTNRETGEPSQYANLHLLAGFESVAVSYPKSWAATVPPEGAHVEVECSIFAGSGAHRADNERVSFVAREVRVLAHAVLARDGA